MYPTKVLLAFMVFVVCNCIDQESKDENFSCPEKHVKWIRIRGKETIYRCKKELAYCKEYVGDKCVSCHKNFRIRQDNLNNKYCTLKPAFILTQVISVIILIFATVFVSRNRRIMRFFIKCCCFCCKKHILAWHEADDENNVVVIPEELDMTVHQGLNETIKHETTAKLPQTVMDNENKIMQESDIPPTSVRKGVDKKHSYNVMNEFTEEVCQKISNIAQSPLEKKSSSPTIKKKTISRLKNKNDITQDDHEKAQRQQMKKSIKMKTIVEEENYEKNSSVSSKSRPSTPKVNKHKENQKKQNVNHKNDNRRFKEDDNLEKPSKNPNLRYNKKQQHLYTKNSSIESGSSLEKKKSCEIIIKKAIKIQSPDTAKNDKSLEKKHNTNYQSTPSNTNDISISISSSIKKVKNRIKAENISVMSSKTSNYGRQKSIKDTNKKCVTDSSGSQIITVFEDNEIQCNNNNLRNTRVQSSYTRNHKESTNKIDKTINESDSKSNIEIIKAKITQKKVIGNTNLKLSPDTAKIKNDSPLNKKTAQTEKAIKRIPNIKKISHQTENSLRSISKKKRSPDRKQNMFNTTANEIITKKRASPKKNNREKSSIKVNKTTSSIKNSVKHSANFENSMSQQDSLEVTGAKNLFQGYNFEFQFAESDNSMSSD